MKIGNLLRSLFFRIFFISVSVSSYLFWGARSTLVIMMKNGILRKRHNPICSLVIFWRPILAPTTTQPKFLHKVLYYGSRPVSPLIVVLRYFSWPHKSTNEIILWLSLTISFQYLFLFWLNLSGIICYPFSLKPMIYWPMELVLPLSCSCW